MILKIYLLLNDIGVGQQDTGVPDLNISDIQDQEQIPQDDIHDNIPDIHDNNWVNSWNINENNNGNVNNRNDSNRNGSNNNTPNAGCSTSDGANSGSSGADTNGKKVTRKRTKKNSY